jgi:hypothetical protein
VTAPSFATERRFLQACIALAGIVPVTAGTAGATFGLAFLNDRALLAADVAADSHFRYLSGLLLAIGIAFWAAVPEIERHTMRIRILTGVVVAGGLARLCGAVGHGYPGAGMTFGLFMELAVTPALCAWQTRIARRTSPTRT